MVRPSNFLLCMWHIPLLWTAFEWRHPFILYHRSVLRIKSRTGLTALQSVFTGMFVRNSDSLMTFRTLTSDQMESLSHQWSLKLPWVLALSLPRLRVKGVVSSMIIDNLSLHLYLCLIPFSQLSSFYYICFSQQLSFYYPWTRTRLLFADDMTSQPSNTLIQYFYVHHFLLELNVSAIVVKQWKVVLSASSTLGTFFPRKWCPVRVHEMNKDDWHDESSHTFSTRLSTVRVLFVSLLRRISRVDPHRF